MATQIYKSPNRFLFIASIGNPAPYTETRHSAGHLLLDALQPHLHERIGLSTPGSSSKSLSKSIFYSTWKSPSLMNISGPPVLRQLKSWLTDRKKYFDTLINNNNTAPDQSNDMQLLKSSSPEPITVNTRVLTQRFRPTLVILHDELEARPGQIKIRRGGPQQASLRGHKGLISIMESLRGAGLLSSSTTTTGAKSATSMAILRIGIGIGRPSSRERNAVADYVLSKMGPQEMQALREAVPEVVELLVQEIYRRDEDEV
jgi:PTH1 family peptidyl-tRNA hydrolase